MMILSRYSLFFCQNILCVPKLVVVAHNTNLQGRKNDVFGLHVVLLAVTISLTRNAFSNRVSSPLVWIIIVPPQNTTDSEKVHRGIKRRFLKGFVVFLFEHLVTLIFSMTKGHFFSYGSFVHILTHFVKCYRVALLC